MKISDSNVNVVTLSCRAHFFRSPCMMEMALTCDPTKVSIRETEQLKQPAVGAFRLVLQESGWVQAAVNYRLLMRSNKTETAVQPY